MLARGAVVHPHTIPIAWTAAQGNPQRAWLPLWEAMLRSLRGALPKALPAYVLTNRGVWSPELFWAVQRHRQRPLRRITAQGDFCPLWGRRQRLLVAVCAARAGQQGAIVGEAFRYRLRCAVMVFWGAGARDGWYLRTALRPSAVCGAW